MSARMLGRGAPTASRTGPSARGGASTVTRTGAPTALVTTARPSALLALAAGITAETTGPFASADGAPTAGVDTASAGELAESSSGSPAGRPELELVDPVCAPPGAADAPAPTG